MFSPHPETSLLNGFSSILFQVLLKVRLLTERMTNSKAGKQLKKNKLHVASSTMLGQVWAKPSLLFHNGSTWWSEKLSVTVNAGGYKLKVVGVLFHYSCW